MLCMVVIVMVVVIVLVLTWIVAFFVMLDVCLGSDAFEMDLELTVPLLFGQWADLHVDISPGHFGLLIHMAHVQKIFFDLFGERVAEFLMGDLTAAELKLDAHFMTFCEEVFGVGNLDQVVVRVDADAEFQLLHFATFVVLVSFLLMLFLHVLVFAVIDDFADRRFSIWGDFDKVESAFLGHSDGLMRGQDAILGVIDAIYDADFRCADALIDTSLIYKATVVWPATSWRTAIATTAASHGAIATTHRWPIATCCATSHRRASCWAWPWRRSTKRTLSCWRWCTCRTCRRVGVCLTRSPCELVAAQVLEWVANRIPPGWIRNSKSCLIQLFERVSRVGHDLIQTYQSVQTRGSMGVSFVSRSCGMVEEK